MSNIIPVRPTLRSDSDETAVVEQVKQIPGEFDLDRVIKAQLSNPEVAQRISELENCVWAMAQELLRLDPQSVSAERAKRVLKNRLEITDGDLVTAVPYAETNPSELRHGLPFLVRKDEDGLPGETWQEREYIELLDDENEDGGET